MSEDRAREVLKAVTGGWTNEEAVQAMLRFADEAANAQRERCAAIAKGQWAIMAGTIEQHREREYYGNAVATAIRKDPTT